MYAHIMKIISVLDLKNNIVVHAQKGERHTYAPVRSCLTSKTDPISVVKAFQAQLNLHEFYIADLDAIQRTGRNYTVIADIIRQVKNVNLIVDAGIATVEAAQEIVDLGVGQIVVGSETLENLDDLLRIVERFGQQRVIFSLDMKAHQVLSSSLCLRKMPPQELARRVQEIGIRTVILLELDRVGTGSGVDVTFFTSMAQACPELTFIAGGGIKNMEDLKILQRLGIHGALVATALHNGTITAERLKTLIL